MVGVEEKPVIVYHRAARCGPARVCIPPGYVARKVLARDELLDRAVDVIDATERAYDPRLRGRIALLSSQALICVLCTRYLRPLCDIVPGPSIALVRRQRRPSAYRRRQIRIDYLRSMTAST